MDEAREAEKRRRVGSGMKARVSRSEWLYSGPGLTVLPQLVCDPSQWPQDNPGMYVRVCKKGLGIVEVCLGNRSIGSG